MVDGFALMSYSAAIEPLRAANLIANKTIYSIHHIAAAGDHSVSSSGAYVPASIALGESSDFDLVLVVAGGDPIRFDNKTVFEWLRHLARDGVKLGGVSGGPVILGLAGVMTGRRLTVHWEHAAAFAERMPKLMLERSLYVIDRDRMTCAGGVAPLDMMHSLLAEHHGPSFARRVSDWFMHTEIRPSGGPQRAGLAQRYATNKQSIILAIEAMENHIADPLDLTQIAQLSGVSTRQINRLFQQEMGQTTMRFYRSLRLAKAHDLLSKSTLSGTEIGMAAGFVNPAHFSSVFQQEFGFPPSSLRKRSVGAV